MKKYYRFAGCGIEVEIEDAMMYETEGCLQPFSADCVENAHRFHFRIVDALEPPGGECLVNQGGFRLYREDGWDVRYIGSVQTSWEPAYIRAAHRGREHRVQLKRSEYAGRVNVNSVLNSISAEHLIARAGGFVFHCAYIQRQGRAILFTAPSGTGKSTQAALWNSLRGTPIINGDRAAVRITEAGILAEGIPFSGSSVHCENRSLPLEAIVYLKQAPRTTIRQLRGYEAFARVWEGVSVNTWDKTDMELVSDAVERTAAGIPVYCLSCTPDESAVAALERVLESR